VDTGTGNEVDEQAWVSEETWPQHMKLLEMLPTEKRRSGATDFQFREGGGDGTAWDKRFLQQNSENVATRDEWYICYEDSPELQEFMRGTLRQVASFQMWFCFVFAPLWCTFCGVMMPLTW
jgi:hypothetical protein